MDSSSNASISSLCRGAPPRSRAPRWRAVRSALAIATLALAVQSAPRAAHATGSETAEAREMADPADTGATPATGEDDTSGSPERDRAPVAELVDAVARATTGDERIAAAERLARRGSASVAELTAVLGRPRSSIAEDRRAVLVAIAADVPDQGGRFRTPKRRKEAVNRGDDFDWLAALAELDSRPGAAAPSELPGMADVAVDVAVIRALAASRVPDAARAILEFAFTDEGRIYRDECGRYLRKMSPYSLPTLIVAARATGKDYRRYADYQLDRLDRQDPNKALADAQVDHQLELAAIRAYGVSKHRAAFPPLLALANHPVKDLRETARQSLMAFLTGPPPRPAPKRKLVLPGGKLSEEEEPLWLTYRELAEVELHRVHREVFGDRAPSSKSPAALAKKLFAHYDAARAAREAEAYDQARALAQAQKWAEAAAAFDRILARDADHPERAAMAETYFEYGNLLAAQGAHGDAAAAYSKAHGLDPGAPFADRALANQHLALGKAMEAEGKDGSSAFRRAKKAAPRDRLIAAQVDRARGDRWMLYSGIAGGAGALIFLILSLAARRR